MWKSGITPAGLNTSPVVCADGWNLYQADVESLAKEVQETRYDGQVLAYLISTQGGFEKAIQDRYAKEYPAAGIQGVPDYQARQEKYQKVPKEKWQEEFQKLVRQVEIKAMKRQFLIVKAISESQELDDVLPAEHRRVLQEATEVLQKYSDLERTADQIAVMQNMLTGISIWSVRSIWTPSVPT